MPAPALATTGLASVTLWAMDASALLQNHVYTAVVQGSLVEGETTVVLAGYAAHQGYAPWWAVALLAAATNFCLDQGYYALGR